MMAAALAMTPNRKTSLRSRVRPSNRPALSQKFLAQLLRRFRRPLGMILQVQIHLDWMNAANAIAIPRAVKHTFHVWHNKPNVLAALFRVKTHLLPRLDGRKPPDVENHKSEYGELVEQPCRRQSRSCILNLPLLQLSGQVSQHIVTGTGGDMAAHNMVL